MMEGKIQWHQTIHTQKAKSVGFEDLRDCKQLNILTKDGIIFRKFQGQVSASLVCVNVRMKRG